MKGSTHRFAHQLAIRSWAPAPKRFGAGAQLAVLLLLLLLPASASAQKMKTRMADKYAEVFDYPTMTTIYEDLVLKGKADAAMQRRLAWGYMQMGDYAQAEMTYARMALTPPMAAEDMWNYAEVLRAQGKYNDALAWYAKYREANPDDARVLAYLDRGDVFARMKRDSARFTLRSLPINSAQADLAPTVMDDLLVFASARGEGEGGKSSYKWDDQPFLNLHTALLKGQNAEDPLVMRKDVNSRYHDGTATYDSTAKRLYFTRDNWHYGVLAKSETGELKLGIYYSDIVMGEFGQKEWGALIPFDHNDPEHNYGHPCVSPDGKRLYFVSDAPGGQGGTDIWYSDNLGNAWGVPVNMGTKVNTGGDEMYPFITRDSTFYFTSNGHAGLGGQDIFWCKLTREGPGNVFNMGYAMNTRYNDHGLIVLRDDTTGFFASDRPGGQGSDDLYGATIRPPMMYLAGIVIDAATKEPIEGATILLKDENNQHVKRFQLESEPGGKFRIEAEYHEKYLLVANKNGYFQKEMLVSTSTDPLENIVVEMNKYDYGAEGVVYHGETEQPLPGAVVRLYDGADKLLEEKVVGADGKYAFTLMPESDYRLRVEKEGFFKQSARISTKGKAAAVIHTDFRLFPLEVGQVVRLENIYYDYNKWNIRSDAAVELDKLVQTLLDNPSVKIELSAHTDCRGSDSYNQGLSAKRAKSAVDYIIKAGIPKTRITSKGYGESLPSVNCDCTKCSEDEHQRNRRTEFKVLEK